jgi:hypothetical protein
MDMPRLLDRCSDTQVTYTWLSGIATVARYADTKRGLHGGGDSVHVHLRDLEDSIKGVNSESILKNR